MNNVSEKPEQEKSAQRHAESWKIPRHLAQLSRELCECRFPRCHENRTQFLYAKPQVCYPREKGQLDPEQEGKLKESWGKQFMPLFPLEIPQCECKAQSWIFKKNPQKIHLLPSPALAKGPDIWFGEKYFRSEGVWQREEATLFHYALRQETRVHSRLGVSVLASSVISEVMGGGGELQTPRVSKHLKGQQNDQRKLSQIFELMLSAGKVSDWTRNLFWISNQSNRCQEDLVRSCIYVLSVWTNKGPLLLWVAPSLMEGWTLQAGKEESWQRGAGKEEKEHNTCLFLFAGKDEESADYFLQHGSPTWCPPWYLSAPFLSPVKHF